MKIRDLIKGHVENSLIENQFNRERTAQKLDISKRTLQIWINHYKEIEPNNLNWRKTFSRKEIYITEEEDPLEYKYMPTNKERLEYLDNKRR